MFELRPWQVLLQCSLIRETHDWQMSSASAEWKIFLHSHDAAALSNGNMISIIIKLWKVDGMLLFVNFKRFFETFKQKLHYESLKCSKVCCVLALIFKTRYISSDDVELQFYRLKTFPDPKGGCLTRQNRWFALALVCCCSWGTCWDTASDPDWRPRENNGQDLCWAFGANNTQHQSACASADVWLGSSPRFDPFYSTRGPST